MMQHTDGDFDHDGVATILADIAEVFSSPVDTDGLGLFLEVCLETTGLTTGRVRLDDGNGGVECAVASPRDFADERPATAVLRCLSTLRPEVDHDERGTVHAFPLRARGRAIGALELIAEDGTEAPSAGRDIVQCLADLAATTIEHSRTVDQSARLVSQLQTALEHRVVLEQAKGVLAERLGVDCATAFREIRATARREQKPIGAIAATIIAGRAAPRQ